MIVSTKNTFGYINEITKYLDKHLEKSYKSEDLYCNYLFEKPYENYWTLRVPGATRGHIELNGNIIKDIVLYEDSFCYESKVLDSIKQFVGRKLDLFNL